MSLKIQRFQYAAPCHASTAAFATQQAQKMRFHAKKWPEENGFDQVLNFLIACLRWVSYPRRIEVLCVVKSLEATHSERLHGSPAPVELQRVGVPGDQEKDRSEPPGPLLSFQ